MGTQRMDGGFKIEINCNQELDRSMNDQNSTAGASVLVDQHRLPIRLLY